VPYLTGRRLPTFIHPPPPDYRILIWSPNSSDGHTLLTLDNMASASTRNYSQPFLQVVNSRYIIRGLTILLLAPRSDCTKPTRIPRMIDSLVELFFNTQDHHTRIDDRTSNWGTLYQSHLLSSFLSQPFSHRHSRIQHLFCSSSANWCEISVH